jgi:hypothetical protein
MFASVSRNRSPLTLAKLESFSPNGLKCFLEQSEKQTLIRIENTLNHIQEIGKTLTKKQIEIDTAVCWELYFREAARKAEKAFVTPDNDDQVVNLHRERFLNAKKIGNMKQMLVNEKRRLRKEAWIAEIGENASRRKYGRKLSSRKTRDLKMQDVN